MQELPQPYARVLSGLAVVVAVVLTIATPASARMMPHTDLRSLFLSSQRVIEAERVTVRSLGQGQRATTFRVQRSYKGGLRPGDTIEVAGPSSYAFEGMGTASMDQPIPDRVVLFLTQRTQVPAGQPQWLITLSGVRMLRGGKAFRFEQHDNPGPFVPVPHRRDPFDLVGLPGAGAQLTEKELEADLVRAAREASAVERALLEADPVKARAALLPLLGPAPSARRHAAIPPPGFFQDVAAMRILRRLAQLGDLDGVLAAWSRLRSSGPRLGWPAGFDEARFFGAAEDTERALEQRVAALRIIRQGGLPSDEKGTMRAIAMLADGAAHLRSEVVGVLTRREPKADVSAALTSRWSQETHPRVQHALLVAASTLGITSQLERAGRPDLVVTAHREQDVVEIGYAAFPPGSFHLRSAVVVVQSDGGAARNLELVEPAGVGGWSAGAYGGARLRMDPQPALAPGTYALTLEVKLQSDAGEERSQDFVLGSWAITAPPPAPAAPAPPPPVLRVEVPSEFPAPRAGCACGVAGRRGEVRWTWLVGALLAVSARRLRQAR